MLRRFAGIIARIQRPCRTPKGITTAPRAIVADASSNSQSVFEVWLRAYREQLEQACGGPDSTNLGLTRARTLDQAGPEEHFETQMPPLTE